MKLLSTLIFTMFLSTPLLANDTLDQIVTEIWNTPELDGYVMEVCVDNQCSTVDKTYLSTRKKQGMKKSSNKAEIVSSIVNQVAGKASLGGSVSVSYEHSQTNPDGSSSTTKVTVEVSAGNGKAGEAAAGD